jgi:2-iminobutanoate/2-iminopropanoate deaminase
MKQIISTTHAPTAIGPYSQAVKTGNILFMSGQLGIDPSTGDFVSGLVTKQTEQVFKNIQAILAAANLSLQNVVKTTIFLTDIAYFSEVNEVYGEYFCEPYPARSTVAVKTLPKNALVEIEVIAIEN